MAKPLSLTLDFLVFEGSATNNPADAIKIKKTVQETDVSEVFRKMESVADGASDQSIPLPDASSEYLVIFTDQEISIKVNGSTTALTLKPKAAGTKTPAFYWRGTITALTVSNGSGNAANVDIIAVNS